MVNASSFFRIGSYFIILMLFETLIVPKSSYALNYGEVLTAMREQIPSDDREAIADFTEKIRIYKRIDCRYISLELYLNNETNNFIILSNWIKTSLNPKIYWHQNMISIFLENLPENLKEQWRTKKETKGFRIYRSSETGVIEGDL